MSQEFFQVLISATSEEEAQSILKMLVEQRLIAGGLISKGSSLYWWGGKTKENIYYNLSTFTVAKHKNRIIEEIKKVHKDEVPIITFFKIDDANPEFLDWVKKNIE